MKIYFLLGKTIGIRFPIGINLSLWGKLYQSVLYIATDSLCSMDKLLEIVGLSFLVIL